MVSKRPEVDRPFNRFRDSREFVEDETHAGWPHSAYTTETTEKVPKHVILDRRLTIPVLANELNISKEVVTQSLGPQSEILPQDLFEKDSRTSEPS